MYFSNSFFTTEANKYTPIKLAKDIKNIIESAILITGPKLIVAPKITNKQYTNLKLISAV